MTNIRNIIGTIFIFTLLLSCDNNRAENKRNTTQEDPESLQDDKLEIKSYSRSGDLTEELYQEQVDKTPGLKKLEDDLDAFRSKPNDLTNKFNKYDSKSNSYYGSANYKAAAITDSLLRLKMLALIGTSKNQYTSKTSELNSLLKQISRNGATLNDHYSVLKIALTLPLIEKYQDNNKPDKQEFKKLINQQEGLIEMTDNLTPNF